MNIYCTHDDCRAHTKEELLHMSSTIPMSLERRAQVIEAADQACVSQVRCRRVARKGAVEAPLP